MARVLFLIDESSALAARVAEGTKSKADCLATALNALLSQLAAGISAEVALVGYRLADDFSQDAGCRWGGPLEGRRWVNTAALEACPRAVEDRVRKIPGPGGYGVSREETVRFPVWYVPVLKAPGSRRTAWEFCRALLAPDAAAGLPNSVGTDRDTPVPPLVIHAMAELSDEGGFRAAGEVFAEPNWSFPAPLVFHAHLSSSGRVPATLYPSSDANLSPELLRHAFHASSILPDPLAASLRAAGVPIQHGARGLIYNARMVDLIRLLGLVKAYVAWASALCAGLPTPHTDRPEVSGSEGDLRSGDRRGQETCAEGGGQETFPRTSEVSKTSEVCGAPPSPALPLAASLAVFVLDRSCATPDTSGNDPKSPWRRLQDRANDLIAQLARQTTATLEIAIVAYGADPSGGVEVTAGFAGSATGRTWLGPGEVADGASRVEERAEQVSDGVGGLLKIARKHPLLFDLTPTAPASPAPALTRVAEMLIRWAEAHPGVRARPVVLHCTRGEFEPDAVRQSVAGLREAERATGPIALYHAILTESAHRAVAYPAAPDGIESDALRVLWELTSPLLGGAALAGKRSGVSAESRGMVINAPFDALTDAVGGGS